MHNINYHQLKINEEKDMKSRLLNTLFSVLLFYVTPSISVQAAVIHESAYLGTTGFVTGHTISDLQYYGSRFSLTETMQVDHIGGHIGMSLEDQVSGNKLFGAIVNLSSSSSIPIGSPFDAGEVEAYTTFSVFDSTDILIPLNVTLSAGDYGVVFGSGLFGATATGFMPGNDTDIPGSSSYFRYDNFDFIQWFDGGPGNTRFVVTGSVVPVPAAAWLFGSGLLGLIGVARRKKA